MAEEPAPSQSTAHLERMLEIIPSRLRSARARFTVSTHRSEALFALRPTVKLPECCAPRPGSVLRSSPPEETESVDWAFSGDRLYHNSESSFWGHRIDVVDGDHMSTFRECTIPGFKTSPQGSIRGRPLQFTSPLDFGYFIECRWIFDILKGGDTFIKEREKDPTFGDVVSVESVQREGNVYRLWFAPERGYMAVSADYEQHNSVDPDRWYVTRVRCDRAIEDNGIWFPGSGVSEKFQVLSNDVEHPVPFIRRDYIATSVQVNHVPESLFDMNFPTGTMIWDAINRKRYYMGDDRASIAEPGTCRTRSPIPISR